MDKKESEVTNESDFDKVCSLDNTLINVDKKIINSITSNRDSYSWIELDCFYRPWAILFESFYPEYFDIFLFYASYHSSFVPNGQFEKYTFEDFYQSVLEDKFGLYIKRIAYYSMKDMHQKIRTEINNNSRILLPADLIGLSYNIMYKKVSHAHHFIVKGYDLERRIYFLLDNMHVDGGASTIYKDFAIKYDELYHMNMLYFKYRAYYKEKNFFWVLNKVSNTNEPKVTFSNVLLEHYEHFKEVNDNKSGIKYLEKELLKGIEMSAADEYKNILGRKNFKAVYYSILFKFLSKAGIGHEQFNQLEDQKKILEEGWNKYTTKVIYKLTKNDYNFVDLRPLEENNIRNEKIFREKYIDLVSKLNLEESIKDRSKPGTDSLWVEKNNNKAVIINEDGKIQIIHSHEKRYDTWITEDNAPQMLICREKNSNFSIEANVTVSNRDYYPFFAGIIVKFVSGIKIMFGNCKNEKVVVFCPENQNYTLYERTYGVNDLYLKVSRNENRYTLYCKTETMGEWQKQFVVESSEQVECFGFISRTWEFVEHRVAFSEIKYSFL